MEEHFSTHRYLGNKSRRQWVSKLQKYLISGEKNLKKNKVLFEKLIFCVSEISIQNCPFFFSVLGAEPRSIAHARYWIVLTLNYSPSPWVITWYNTFCLRHVFGQQLNYVMPYRQFYFCRKWFPRGCGDARHVDRQWISAFEL